LLLGSTLGHAKPGQHRKGKSVVRKDYRSCRFGCEIDKPSVDLDI